MKEAKVYVATDEEKENTVAGDWLYLKSLTVATFKQGDNHFFFVPDENSGLFMERAITIGLI